MPNQDDCFIGVQKLPENQEVIRLGTLFLKNVFVGLDYEQNMIMLGVNKGTNVVKIAGKTNNPNVSPTPPPKRRSSNGLFFLLLFIFILVIIALSCYLRAKKNERDRTVTFSTTAQSSAKKTYRNGVEVKPSDLSAKVNTRINDSVIDEDN